MPRCGSPMKLGIQVEGKTDVGRDRTNNEDNLGFDIREGIFVVCDGMDGRAAGERASQIAVETVLGYFQHDLHGADTQILGKTFESVSQRANALGSEESVDPDLEDHDSTPVNILLLCSDGLSRYVKESMILEISRGSADLELACENVIDAVKNGGSDDNITCLLLRAV